ncbi:MAG: hypothetical protein DMG08_15435 [Acidobacteria bacterium]|nr:MAG: hypothetical protein DMG08_15435 [Acidobacteriota bacterium]
MKPQMNTEQQSRNPKNLTTKTRRSPLRFFASSCLRVNKVLECFSILASGNASGVAGQSVNYEPARGVLYCCFFEDESK